MALSAAPSTRLIGAVIALLVTALMPRDPGREAARDRVTLLSVFVESLGSIVDALDDADPASAALALERLRRTQPLVDAWRTSLDTAIAVARVSPWLRARLLRAAGAMRGCSRPPTSPRGTCAPSPAASSSSCGTATPGRRSRASCSSIAVGVGLLGDELADPQVAGAARSLLTDVMRRLDPAVVIPDAGISDATVVLMLRPLLVDLLVGTGMPIDEARALLPKID